MKVGDLIRYTGSGDWFGMIGIIWNRNPYWWFVHLSDGTFIITKEYLEVISEKRRLGKKSLVEIR